MTSCYVISKILADKYTEICLRWHQRCHNLAPCAPVVLDPPSRAIKPTQSAREKPVHTSPLAVVTFICPLSLRLLHPIGKPSASRLHKALTRLALGWMGWLRRLRATIVALKARMGQLQQEFAKPCTTVTVAAAHVVVVPLSPSSVVPSPAALVLERVPVHPPSDAVTAPKGPDSTPLPSHVHGPTASAPPPVFECLVRPGA